MPRCYGVGMKRIWGGVAVILGALALAGCTAAETSTDNMQSWLYLQDSNAESTPDLIGYANGVTGGSEARPTSNGVVTYDDPVNIDTMTFDCKGPDTMDLEVEIVDVSSTTVHTLEDLACNTDPVVLDVPTPDPVVSIRISGVSTDPGAWAVVAEHP